MKIGIVSSYFYPWYGGITEHVYHQYKGLKQRGHTVRLITPFDGRGVLQDPDDLIKLGRPVSLLLNGSVVKVPLLFKPKRAMEKILSTERFDVIHLHQPLFCFLGLNFLKCILERKNNNSYIPHVVGTFHACGGGTERFVVNRLSFFFRKFREAFDCRIAVSAASRDFITPILPGDYSIIPNGVDVTRFSSELERIAQYDDGILNILFVGRLEPRKGLTTLLKCVPYISKYSQKPFRVLVVGNGVMTRYYKSRVPREALKRVVFVGEASPEDLPRYYKTAHVFCSPASYGESFGIVLIEAMAAGLPIVAVNNEGYRKVIGTGVNGVLVEPENPEMMAAQIGRLLNNEDERRLYAVRNIESAKLYSWSSIIDMIEKIYLGFPQIQHSKVA